MSALATVGGVIRPLIGSGGAGVVLPLTAGLPAAVSLTRASSGTYFDSTGTLQTAGSNAPRFGYDPATHGARGLLIEGQSSNVVRNNTMAGLSAGTPGGIPNNWSGGFTGNGLSQTISGPVSVNGMTCFDVRVFGTTTNTISSILYFDASPTAFAASSGQAWTGSVYAALVGGSFANITGLDITMRESDSTPTFLRQALVSLLGVGATPSRVSNTVTIGASTAWLATGIRLGAASGSAIDFTLRIGPPQVEQQALASSLIATSNAAVTRAADLVSLTSSAFSALVNPAAGAVIVDAMLPQGGATNTQVIAAVGNSSGTDRYTLAQLGGTSGVQATVRTSNTVVASTTTIGNVVAGQGFRSGMRWNAGATLACVNGTLSSAVSGAAPATPTTLIIGAIPAGFQLNGYISRLCVLRSAPSDATFRAMCKQ